MSFLCLLCELEKNLSTKVELLTIMISNYMTSHTSSGTWLTTVKQMGVTMVSLTILQLQKSLKRNWLKMTTTTYSKFVPRHV